MIDEASDPLLRNLRRLARLEPDAARSGRVRTRCHAALARHARQADRPSGLSVAAALLERGLLGGVCIVYVSATLRSPR